MDKEQAKARLREDIEALYPDCAVRFLDETGEGYTATVMVLKAGQFLPITGYFTYTSSEYDFNVSSIQITDAIREVWG